MHRSDRTARSQDADDFTCDFTPCAEVRELPDRYLIELEIPGLLEREAFVALEENRLVLRGEVHDGASVGPFQHRLHLPDDADWRRSQVRCAGGVLVVEVPRAEWVTIDMD